MEENVPRGEVLLVDDEVAVRSTLRAVLESQGYHCKEAENGAEALEYLELNGVEFLEKLAEKGGKNPPVIFFTGDLSMAERDRALRAGARAVLEKPPNFGEIISAVAQALAH